MTRKIGKPSTVSPTRSRRKAGAVRKRRVARAPSDPWQQDQYGALGFTDLDVALRAKREILRAIRAARRCFGELVGVEDDDRALTCVAAAVSSLVQAEQEVPLRVVTPRDAVPAARSPRVRLS